MGRQISIESFDRTVSDIYEAALDPSHWDVALASIVNRSAPHLWDVAFLIWERLQPPAGRFVGAVGVNDFARAGYLQAFVGRNPWSERAYGLPIGSIVHTDEIVSRGELRSSALYQAYLCNWNLETAIIGQVDRSGADRLGLVLPGPDSGDVRGLMEAVRRYLPHIQRANRISRKLGEANLRAANAEAALEKSPGPALVLGPDMTLLYANRLGHEMIETGFARIHGGRLRFARDAHSAVLKALSSDPQSPPSAAFLIEHGELEPYRMLAMRIEQPIAQTLSGIIEGGSILLVGNRYEGGIRPEIMERYCDWFGMTPAEARLAAMLAQGATLEDFAASRGVTVNAGRFLLKGIFSKTGVSKQAQLVALLRDAPDGFVAAPH
jgi:DNA-binding CsgD family transcriptional regulator/PAS domain-containing protein